MVERDGRGPLVGSSTTGEATGGGRGRSQVAGDGVGRRIGGVGRRAGVDTGLRASSGADVAGRRGEGMEKLGVAVARLALPTAAEVAAAGNKEPCQDDGEDRGEAGTEARPVYINKQESIIGLVQRDVAGLIHDTVLDGEIGVILHVDGRSSSRGASFLGKVLFNEPLSSDLVNELLTVTNEEGCHVGAEEDC